MTASPGKYLAIDCEMVGVGIDGEESSLARVSIVNYWGKVQLDEFVKQKERVADYRTKWSGIRPSDMVKGRQALLSTPCGRANIIFSQAIRGGAENSRSFDQRSHHSGTCRA